MVRRNEALVGLSDLVERGLLRLGVEANARIVLAVSGGADSMALLHGAAERRHRFLVVAHLDHGLRPESAEDAAFVAEAAADLGLPSAIRRIDVAAIARTEGLSTEEAGRQARYAFLDEVAGDDGLIATAHTLDDSAETVVLNLMRGCGLGGVGGIPVRRGRILRPLLHARRSALRTLLDEAGLAYRDDPTNDDPAFLRNRLRGEVIPLLEDLRPGVVERIARYSALARDDDALLDELAAAELAHRRDSEGRIDWHDPPAPALGRRVLRLAIGDPAPSAERLEALREAAGGARGGLRVELGGGRVASVRERVITLHG